jgi:glycogen synthase
VYVVMVTAERAPVAKAGGLGDAVAGLGRNGIPFFIKPHAAANSFGRDRLYGYGGDPERFAFFPGRPSSSCARPGWWCAPPAP